MKRLLWLFLLISTSALAQFGTVSNVPLENLFCQSSPTLGSYQTQNGAVYTCGVDHYWHNLGTQPFAGVPTGTCTTWQLSIDTTTGDLYDCYLGQWNKVTNSGGGVTSVTGTTPIASTGGLTPAISLKNSGGGDVTASLGTDAKIFTASGAAAMNGNVIVGDAQGGIKDSGTAISLISLPSGIKSQTLGYGLANAATAYNGPVYPAALYGVAADGTNQCGSNLNALIAAVNATGGTILFDTGTTLLSTCNLAGSLKLAPNVILAGRGSAQVQNQLVPATPPAILKMTYAGTDVAHIECLTYGGYCGAENLTVQDDTTSLPFFLYTGGIPYLDQVTCWGMNNRMSGLQPVNDCVWLGNGTNHTCSAGAIETDGFCGYGEVHISIYGQNIRRALVFGSNANGMLDVNVLTNYSDAYVDGSLNPVGGAVEFVAQSGYPSYGNKIKVTTENAPNGDPSHCNYRGSVRLVSNARNNQIDYAGSDMGNCTYSAFIEDNTSYWNQITAISGMGSSGDIYDYNLSSGANTLISLTRKTITTQVAQIPQLGSNSLPVSFIKWSIYTVATLPASPHAPQTAWVSDGATSTDCTTGSGSTMVLCVYNGSAWAAVGGSASTAFSAITSGSNTTSTMTVGTGASLGPTGSGVLNANQVNGASVPTSGNYICTNASGQIVSTGGTCVVAYGFSFSGAVGASATGLIQANSAATLPANLTTPTSTCKCGTNPTSAFLITLKDGATTVGTISLSSSCVATLATTGGTTQALAVDDQLYAVAPGSADATAANISCLVRATRN